jgi:hypothetical protein
MIVIMSLWRNDADRQLEERIDHLLAKKCVHHEVRWLWAVGDSTDDTEYLLRRTALAEPRITVIRSDSGVEGNDLTSRRFRASWTASHMFSEIHEDAKYACLHESDLLSPPDVLDKLLATKTPVAAWPVIRLNGHPQFYDIWAFRGMDGVPFRADMQPPAYPICVRSFGSCWIAPANLVRNRVLDETAIVGLCQQWHNEGVTMWVNPSVVVEQPTGLWELS